MPLRHTLAALLPFICAPAMAQQPAPPEPALAARAAGRFPQPVRVGDLLRRQVLPPRPPGWVIGCPGARRARSDR